MSDNPFLNNGQSRLPTPVPPNGAPMMLCHRDKLPCVGEACHLFVPGEPDSDDPGSCAEADAIHDRARIAGGLAELVETYGPRVLDLAFKTGLVERAMTSEALAALLQPENSAEDV